RRTLIPGPRDAGSYRVALIDDLCGAGWKPAPRRWTRAGAHFWAARSAPRAERSQEGANEPPLAKGQGPAVGRAERGGRVDPEQVVDGRGQVLGGDRVAGGGGPGRGRGRRPGGPRRRRRPRPAHALNQQR